MSDFSHVNVGGVFRELVRPVTPADVMPNGDFASANIGSIAAQVGSPPHIEGDWHTHDWGPNPGVGALVRSITHDATVGHTNPGSLKLVAEDNRNVNIFRKFPTKPNQQYVVRAWALGGATRIGLSFYTAAFAKLTSPAAPPGSGLPDTGSGSEWNHLEASTGPAPADAAWVVLNVGIPGDVTHVGLAHFDEIEVIDVTTPEAHPAYVNVAGAWKAAVEGWVRVGAEWKKLWPEPKPPFDGGIVRNGDFSTPDVSQWGIGTGGVVSYDPAVGRTSPGSVMLTAAADNQSLNIHDIPITGGQTLAWDLWAMHDAIPNRVSAPFDPSHWGLQPVFADAAGTTLPDQPKIPAPVVPAVNEWVHFTGSHVAPAGAVKVRFRLMGGHVGKMWLDDVRITVT